MEAYSISGSNYVKLRDDGTDYAITDVSRWELNISSLPSLPTAAYDWSLFPNLELPQVETRHFTNGSGEVLFIRNLYETRRMQYTIYNVLGEEPSAWKNGKPLATVQLTIPADLEPHTASMWLWHTSEDAVCQGHLRKSGFFCVRSISTMHLYRVHKTVL